MNTIAYRRFAARILALIFLVCSLVCSAVGQVNVLTNRYNQSRTAANVNETQLTTANVNTSSFGKLGSYSVDGVIYAQPLYVEGLTVAGATHNVLYVATMHDVLYAFDADNVGSLPLWTLDFRNLAAGITPAPVHVGVGDGTDGGVADTFGILSTPVIDLANNRMFLVTHTMENGTECFRLRDVDIRTGALLASTLITGSVAATGSAAGVTLYPPNYGQRAALELADGQVWVAFTSRPSGDYLIPWYGWVMTYDPNTLKQTGVFATSRTNGNGIWESGSGPVVDSSGYVYYLTGNGGAYNGGTEFPETLLQMNFKKNLLLNDWYTPDSVNGDNYYAYLNEYDLDLSVDGPVLIPGTDLIAFGGKSGDMWVIHTGDLGQLTPNDTQLAQFFHVGATYTYPTFYNDRIVGTTYWQSPAGGTLYVWPGLDTLHAYTLNTATSRFDLSYEGKLNLLGSPGTALAISANGSTTGTGILWAPTPNGTNSVGQPGILHAYNAENPAQELWNSNLVATDFLGTLAKFTPPLIANGKVYIANSATINDYGAGSVTVYGLKTAASGHVAPYITLNSPVNSATFVLGSSVELSASAFAGSSPVASVEFVDGTTVLATLTAAPYKYTWSSGAQGSHTVTAVAIDTSGAVTTSVAATITVTGKPTYSLSASPNSLLLPPGGTAMTTVTVTPLSGFAGPVCANLAGLQSGMTSALMPVQSGHNVAYCATSNTFTLTISAATTVPAGSSQIGFITGSNGTSQNTLFIPVTVSPSALSVGMNTVKFNLGNSVKLGTPIVFTEGVRSSSLANPDFMLDAAGNTCTGTVSGTCIVTLQFTPQYAGLRRGAVTLVDLNGNPLSTAYISGMGRGSLPALLPADQKVIYSTGSPHGVAIDGAGNVFMVDATANQVFKIAPGATPVALTLGTTLNQPYALALDAAGNLYIADAGNNRVLKLPYGGTAAAAVNLTGLNYPEGLAVDGSGNLFVANTRATATSGFGTIVELSAGTGTQTTVVGTGLGYPSAVALDAVGDLFIADWLNNRVLEISAGGTQTSIGSNLAYARGVAVDALGDVFIADQNNNRIVEVPGTASGPGTGTQVTVASSLPGPYSVALDSAGDLFIVDVGAPDTAGNLLEIPRVPSVTFNVPSGVTLGTPIVFTEGVRSSSLTNPDFTLDAAGNTCTGTVSGTCIVTLQFTPQYAGLRRGAVTLVDLNGNPLSTAYISGMGRGSLPALLPADQKVIYSTGSPHGVAIDGAGNVFMVDATANQVFKIAPGATPVALPLGTTLNQPYALALDAAGNLYIADAGNNRVLKLPYGGTAAAAVNLTGLNYPEGLAVDGSGNLFVANTRATATSGFGTIVELSAGTGTQTTVVGTGLGYPSAVALDAVGDLFIADWLNNRVLEISAGGTQTSIGSNLAYARGVAVDALGDVFIADQNNNRIVEVPGTASGPGTGTQVTVASSLPGPYSVALDSAGDLFIVDVGAPDTAGNLLEIPR